MIGSSYCLLSVAFLCFSQIAGGQTAPALKIEIQEETFFSEETLAFQLDSFGRAEVWILQSSTNGEDWDDLVFLNGGLGNGGFGVSFDRKALAGEAFEKVLFRAVKQDQDNPTYRDFLAAKMRWREAGYDSYAYVVKSSRGMTEYEARYTVVNGEVTEVETTSAFPPGVEAPADRTIDGWFDQVESAIEQRAAIINVDWNAANGYPESGFIDLFLNLADEEQSWTISELIPLSPASQEFLAARELWREAAIPKYSYALVSSSRGGFYEVRYTVENGETIGMEIIVEPPSFVTVPDSVTMDDLFDRVADAFSVGAFSVDVDWDKTLGYPTRAAIDFDERIADEEQYWITKEFVVLD